MRFFYISDIIMFRIDPNQSPRLVPAQQPQSVPANVSVSSDATPSAQIVTVNAPVSLPNVGQVNDPSRLIIAIPIEQKAEPVVESERRILTPCDRVGLSFLSLILLAGAGGLGYASVLLGEASTHAASNDEGATFLGSGLVFIFALAAACGSVALCAAAIQNPDNQPVPAAARDEAQRIRRLDPVRLHNISVNTMFNQQQQPQSDSKESQPALNNQFK
jgi:hypothetical protein